MKYIVSSYVVDAKDREVAGGPRTFANGASAFVHIFGLVFDAIIRGSEIKFTDLNPDSLTHDCEVSLQYKEVE